ncbi:MAG: AI-2E family transporter [Candidatus Paceibacterota bacterium]
MQETKFIEKYFFIGLLVLAIVLISAILFPFMTIIVMGVAMSVVIYPVYNLIRKIVPQKFNWLASLSTIILFLAVLWIPFLVLGSVAYKQFFNLYNSFDITNGDPVLINLNSAINQYLPSGFAFDLQTEVVKLISTLFTNITSLFTATLNTIFVFFLITLTMFYTLRDGNSWRELFIKLSPLETTHNEKILKTLSGTINGIIKGYLLIAIAQGILMGLGLAIFGVPHPALWGVAAAIMSLVPTIGTAFIAIPTILYLLFMGMNIDAIGLTVWCIAIVGTVDNFLNPLIVGKQTNLHPILVLFSVLGGIALMGPMGILIGPLAVSLLRALFLIYREEIKQ